MTITDFDSQPYIGDYIFKFAVIFRDRVGTSLPEVKIVLSIIQDPLICNDIPHLWPGLSKRRQVFVVEEPQSLIYQYNCYVQSVYW